MKTTDIATAASSLFVVDKPGFQTLREKFNAEPFLFHHHLAGDPRFAIDRIRNLASRLPRKIGFTGNLPVERGFRQPEAAKMSFEEALDQLEAGHCWIILKKVQGDPEYGPLLPQCLAELEKHLGRRLEPLIESRTMSLILSSPGQVTPYHVDADCNFLFQIRGCKSFYAFNGRDRTILPQEEEESFWAGNINAAKYREKNQAKAQSFALEPGNGVHVPVIFPHWVKNGDNLSISLSINFRFLGRLRGDVYRMNHLLRKVGLHPRDAGESKMIDFLKVAVVAPPRLGVQMMRNVLKRTK